MENQELQKFICEKGLTVAEAMRKIDKNTTGILFIVNPNGVLLGCITDGDIRRFLLSGGEMSAMAIDAANKTPRLAKSLEEARILYHKKNYIVIPILDEEGRVIDLYSGESGFQKKLRNPLNIPVVINAGGRGTRLDPFTKVLPKPLIPVGELPIIELIMQEYQSYSCNEFHIIVNYKRNLMKAYFADNDNDYNITWYDEETPLGTGGGLSLLRGKLNRTFFFTNCDTLIQTNYESLLDFHVDSENVITMVCAHKNLTIPYGVIEMGENGVIDGFREKPMLSFLTNTGMYLVEPEVLDQVEDNVPVGFPDVVERVRQLGKNVAVYPISESEWMDMGQLSELEKMRKRLYGE